MFLYTSFWFRSGKFFIIAFLFSSTAMLFAGFSKATLQDNNTCCNLIRFPHYGTFILDLDYWHNTGVNKCAYRRMCVLGTKEFFSIIIVKKTIERTRTGGDRNWCRFRKLIEYFIDTVIHKKYLQIMYEIYFFNQFNVWIILCASKTTRENTFTILKRKTFFHISFLFRGVFTDN